MFVDHKGLLRLIPSQLTRPIGLMYQHIITALSRRKEAEITLHKSYKQLESYSKMLDNEMEKGRQIQKSFLPDQPLEIPGWETAAYFKSAYQVAGDFYDVFELPCRCVGIVVADVCDKGVGAAIFMVLFRSLFRIFSGHAALKGFTIEGTDLQCGEIISASEEPPTASYPPKVLKAVQLTNDYVAKYHGDLGMFATVFFGVLYPVSGSLTYINAGHDPQYIVTPSGGVKAQLNPSGPAVGIDPQSRFGIEQTILEPGDIMLGYTDGVTEAISQEGNFFTTEKLLASLNRPIKSAAELVDRIEKRVAVHMGKAEQHDDITLFAIRRIPLNESGT